MTQAEFETKRLAHQSPVTTSRERVDYQNVIICIRKQFSGNAQKLDSINELT